MKRRIMWFVVACMLMCSLVACGKDKGDDGIDPKSAKVISTDELLSVYDFDIDEYVKLGDYQNLDVRLDKDYSVSEDEIIAYMDSYLAYDNTYTATEKKNVAEGDIVNIDYVGSIDGVEFAGGTDSGAHLTIGSNEFIDGFEAGLVGHNVGEDVTLNLKFPDNYWNEEYAGKDVVFEVKINSIDEADGMTYNTVPEEYIKDTFGYETKQAWYDATAESMKNASSQQQMSDAQEALIAKIMEISEVQVPESLVNAEIDETVRQVKLYAKDSLDGMSVDDYLKQYEDCDSVDAFREKIKDEVTVNLKEQLLIDAIIKDKGNTITEGGFTDFLAYYLESYGMEEKEFYERYGSKKNIMLIYAENMAISEMVDDVIAKSVK